MSAFDRACARLNGRRAAVRGVKGTNAQVVALLVSGVPATGDQVRATFRQSIEAYECAVDKTDADLIGRRSILLTMLSEVLLLGYYLAQEEQ